MMGHLLQKSNFCFCTYEKEIPAFSLLMLIFPAYPFHVKF